MTVDDGKYGASPYRLPLRNRDKEIVDYTLVDEDDYAQVSRYKWHLSQGYAYGFVDRRMIALHHFVFKKPRNGHVIDHMNNDRLDNRKCNLRESTRAENSHNVPSRSGTSKYKGVSWDKNSQKFCAKYGSKHLGLFPDEVSAAHAYDTFTHLLHGDKASNNNIIQSTNATLSSFDIKKKDDLPRHIYKLGESFYALRKYKKKIYKMQMRQTLAESLLDLITINVMINHRHVMEELLYMQTPIPRNENGIAILTCRKSATQVLVDDQDWHHLNRLSWYIDNGYVDSSIVGRLHRYILKAKEGDVVDHINRNKCDNRRSNLRIVSYSVNNNNLRKRDGCTSRHKGVYFRKSRNQYIARIQYNYKTEYLGQFDTEDDAQVAYSRRRDELYPS